VPNYRRAFIPGGTWFFTANLLQRHDNDLLIREISLLRETVRRVRERHPFQIDAWVVLPEHLHCVWTLPSGDSDFSTRWRLIKSGFYVRYPKLNGGLTSEKQPGNVAYGSVITGNILSATTPTSNATSIMFM